MKKRYKAIILSLLIWLFVVPVVCACVRRTAIPRVPSDSLRTADLLFVLNLKGNAITEVTQGVHAMPIDHVGIVLRSATGLFVMEAVPGAGVTLTPLSLFVNQNEPSSAMPSILVGRPRKKIDMRRMMAKWQAYRGLPYDSLYMPDDREMYCSELVQKMLLDADGQPIYPTIPMSFHNKYGKITRYWKRFYHQRGLEVPEGKPGTNPGQLSRDANTLILGMLSVAPNKYHYPDVGRLLDDIFLVADHPESTAYGSLPYTSLRKCYLQEDSLQGVRHVKMLFGQATTVLADSLLYAVAGGPEAFALWAEWTLDPQFTIALPDSAAACHYYERIISHGVLQDERGLRFVYTQNVKPGITQVRAGDSLTSYGRTVALGPPRRQADGWYGIELRN